MKTPQEQPVLKIKKNRIIDMVPLAIPLTAVFIIGHLSFYNYYRVSYRDGGFGGLGILLVEPILVIPVNAILLVLLSVILKNKIHAKKLSFYIALAVNILFFVIIGIYYSRGGTSI